MTAAERQIRANVRNFLMTATAAELEAELAISLERGDHFRAECVRELIREAAAEA